MRTLEHALCKATHPSASRAWTSDLSGSRYCTISMCPFKAALCSAVYILICQQVLIGQAYKTVLASPSLSSKSGIAPHSSITVNIHQSGTSSNHSEWRHTPDRHVVITSAGGSMQCGESRTGRSIIRKTEGLYFSVLKSRPEQSLQEGQVA